MESALRKKATMFRLDIELVNRLKELARNEHRSLNNFVECLLYEVAYNRPNKETIDAFEEAKSGKLKNVSPIDTSSIESMFKSLGL